MWKITDIRFIPQPFFKAPPPPWGCPASSNKSKLINQLLLFACRCEYGCLSIYISSVTNWQLVHGEPSLSPNDSWCRSQSPVTLRAPHSSGRKCMDACLVRLESGWMRPLWRFTLNTSVPIDQIFKPRPGVPFYLCVTLRSLPVCWFSYLDGTMRLIVRTHVAEWRQPEKVVCLRDLSGMLW